MVIPKLRRLSAGSRGKPGERPGLLRRPEGAAPTQLELVSYDAKELEERSAETFDEITELFGNRSVLWVRVRGLADLDLLRKIADEFGVHGLALEDVLGLHSRPKLEDYERGSFFIGRSVEKAEHFVSRQLSLFWGNGFVLSFEEDHGKSLDPVLTRLRQARGKIRHLGADYLAYALIDKVVDDYAPVLEAYEELLDQLEADTLRSQGTTALADLHHLRSQTSEVRRMVRPLRDAVRSAVDGEAQGFCEEVQVYLRDTYDHAQHALEACEVLRDNISSVMDLVFSLQSQRMNDIVKVLTIISTIFIPLSFLAGLYGMNFDTQKPGNLPELAQPYGYPVLLIVMGVLAVLMLLWFWRKGWILSRH